MENMERLKNENEKLIEIGNSLRGEFQSRFNWNNGSKLSSKNPHFSYMDNRK